MAVTLVGRPDHPAHRRLFLSPRPPHRRWLRRTTTVADGRTVELVSLGGPATQTAARPGLRRTWTMPPVPSPPSGATDWPRDIVVVATASDEQFRALAGGGSDIAAATDGQRIVFAPGAADDERRGTANRVAPRAFPLRRPRPRPPPTRRAGSPRGSPTSSAGRRRRGQADSGPAELAQLPSDADLDTEGATRSLAYDRAWWFSRFVADRYGTPTPAPAVRNGPAARATPTSPTAVRETLGADLGRGAGRVAAMAVADSLTAMTRVLLVTNDFPPRRGGIQSYLESSSANCCNRAATTP